MPISPADFVFSLTPNPLKAVIGFTTTAQFSFSNTNLVDTAYNLSLTATLPDGVSFVSSAVVPTQIVNNPGGTITLTWINIKDLAPNELNYILGVTLKSDAVFRGTGLPVPFDIPLVTVSAAATVDTLPRGNDDPGNVKITKLDNANFIPLRYSLTKSGPGKMPKGAGLLIPVTPERWPYTYTLTVLNNVSVPSIVTLVDTLPNGIRYLDALMVSGPDSIALSAPTVIAPPIQDFVTLDWGTVTLSPFSTNIITFTVAIWDNYTVGGVENSGARILHMTPLQNSATLNGVSGPVTSTRTTNAMDATIDKSVTSSNTDVGVVNLYSLVYKINQYDNVNGVVITDTLSDGQIFSTGTPFPDSVTVVAGVTTLIWNLGNLVTGTQGTINFSAITNSNYVAPPGPVSAFDTLTNNVTENGTNANFGTPTPDSSGVNLGVAVPFITKQILGYFYKDGTPKTITTVAPGDFVEFRIDYNASAIMAEQRNILIDDFFPFNMGPLTGLSITYGGTVPAPPPPVTIDPHGLRWTLGTLPANSTFSATFRVQVDNVDFTGSLNNLAKLAGNNTAGLAYSARDQVPVNFGAPNITLTKNVTGPNVNAIKAGETYTYSITIANPQNATNTTVDAFDIDLTDVIPTGLTYTPGSFSVVGTGTFNPPSIIGQNVLLHILKLPPAGTLTLSFNITVNAGITAGGAFTNNANSTNPYSQPFTGVGDFQYTGLNRHAQTTLRSLGVTLTKTPTPLFAKIGDTVTYIITATVPAGTSAYNLQVVDNYPSATQLYLGNATKDGLPIVPVNVPGTVTFPVVPLVTALGSPVNIVYTFDVRVTGGTHVPPFIQNQIDSATVSWELSPGVPATPFTVTAPLQVRTPNLTNRKEQRNVTTGGVFTATQVLYSPGDTITYRLSLTNNGAETAYNTVLTDVLNPLLSFIPGSFIANVPSTPSFAASTVTWNIPQITAGFTATLTFSVLTLPGVPSGGRIPDNAAYVYNTNDNGFGISFGPITTNTVNLRSPLVTISKTSSLAIGQIGDDITYTLTIVVPSGTIAYRLTVDDTLPVGQTYIGPATRQVVPNPAVVIPTSVIGQSVNFLDGNPDIDASAGAVTLIYTFIARITSATHNPPFSETQTNSSRVRWAIVSGGSLTQQATATRSITAQTPNITILKEQSNITTGVGFTTAPIIGLPGDEIQYRFTIMSNGASPAFNIILQDILDAFLTYNGVVFVSTGTVNPPGAALIWTIPVLNVGSSATLVFSTIIASGIGAGGSIRDQGTSTYDSNDVNPITYNANSNQVTLTIPPLTLTKSATPAIAAIGDLINYTLTVTIPSGVAAHNLVVTDVIPGGQSYVPGSWAPGPPPVVLFNKLTYTAPVTPLIGPLVLIYTFQATVISGMLTPPYTVIQSNTAEIVWDITAIGPSAPPVSTIFDVEIRSPHLTSLKQQRLTPGGSFTTGPLMGIVAGDIIEYRITLTNDGAGTAYNVTTTDVLDPALTYQGVVLPAPPGSVVSSVAPGAPDGTITWSGFSIPPAPAPGSTVVLVFSVLVNVGFVVGSRITDQSNTLYDTNPGGALTLGPVPSNEVAFNFTNPLISKTVDPSNVFLGDTVTYTVVLTIVEGNIAYNVQVTDALPPTQTYVPNSLTRNTIPVPSPALVFPPEGTIDAMGGDVTITYTFQATITSLALSPQDIQINSATVNWTLDPAGLNPGPPQVATATVYATDSDITIMKEQQNVTTGGAYTTGVVQAAPGDQINYRLTVSNPGLNAIFNVQVPDPLSLFLQFVSIVAPPPAGVLVHSGVNPGGTVSWHIATIPPLTTYQAEFTVLVLPGVGADSLIPDTAQAFFDATSTPPLIQYGPRTSNTVLLQTPSLQFAKSGPSSQVELGSVFPYTLTVTIPAGLIAYQLVVTDTFPLGQEYAGNATRNGLPVFPTVVGQVVTFPTEAIVDATAGEIIITYAFSVRVITGNLDSPFTVDQTNNATLSWNSDPFGTPATPEMDSQTITVTSPFTFLTKSQSNITQGTGFITSELDVAVGDIVRYRIRVNSEGASPAYNTIVTDILGPFKQFVGIVQVTAGTAVGNGTVTWTIPVLAPGAEEFLIFDIQVLAGISAGGTDSNTASEIYDTNPTTPITLGPTPSNTVVLKYPNVRINKTADKVNAAVGNVITYTVSFVVPRGTVIYNGQFTDTLPVGQNYNNHATINGAPVVPDSVSGQVVIFPAVPFASAGATDLIGTYIFQTLVVSANVDPITLTEVQTNEAVGLWELTPGVPAPPVDSLFDVTVTNSSVQINKAQRNATRGEIFITDPIHAVVSDIIEYRITVTNSGPNTVYNTVALDGLSVNLKFISTVSVPVGTLSYSGGSFNGTVTFTIPTLVSGASATAIFSVQILAENLPQITNSVTGTFNITPTDPTNYQADPSNITLINVDKAVLANLDVSECIIVDKIYSQCQQRVCFQFVPIETPPGYTLLNVVFHPGFIVPGSLELTPIVGRPNFSRVKFVASVPYTATFRNASGDIITQNFSLPDFTVDTILYMPATRSEVSFKILINTRSTLLSIDNVNATISVGIILIISVVAQVQLLIPSAGFCPNVCECEDFIPPQDTTCIDFLNEATTPFPVDFYPLQQDDC